MLCSRVMLLLPRILCPARSHRRHIHQLRRLKEQDRHSLVGRLVSLLQPEAGGGEQRVSTAEAVRRQHGQDEGPELGELPDVVVYPHSVEEVSEICRMCHVDSIPVIPFGTGTGLEAGISATSGGVCLDLSRMVEICDYHPEDFDVAVRPGVTCEALNHHVKGDGLWFPVDPGSNPSICGMCATGASGTNAVRYGTMKENCLNLEVVLADGRVLHTCGQRHQRPRKSSAGLNLTGLFVGSEGVLGVITRATVRLHALPEAIAAAVVGFPTVQAAVDTVVAMMQCSILIARVELLDPLAIKASNSYSGLNLPEQPTLFLEFHSSESGLSSQTQAVADIASGNGGSEFAWATKVEERSKLWRARHKLHYASLGLRPGCRSVTTDVCVPISKLPDMVVNTRADIDASGITGPIFGHVGDGNFHVYLLFDPNIPAEYLACKQAAKRMAARALALGGTCTGEHGVGTGKVDLLKDQFGEVGIGVMSGIKSAVDPKGIMNPGKVLPALID